MNTCDMYTGDTYTVWPIFAKDTCLFVRIFVCGHLHDSDLMTLLYIGKFIH